MMQFRHERMSAEFEKWHVEGLPFPCAVHHFTGPDQGGPHDHPWSFTSHVLAGGYVENIYTVAGLGYVETIARQPGTSHTVEAEHIHRIVALPAGECWTLIVPGPKVREPGWWRFDYGPDFVIVPEFRQWDWPDFMPVEPAPEPGPVQKLTRALMYDYVGKLYTSEKAAAEHATGIARGPYNRDDPRDLERDKAFLVAVQAAGRVPELARFVGQCLDKRAER